MSTSTLNILLAGPVRPAVGGVASVNELICQYFNNTKYRIHILNTWNLKRKLHITSSSHPFNFILQILEILNYIFLLIMKNCQIVQIPLSSHSSCDKALIYSFIVSFLKRKVILHLHGGRFEKYYLESAGIKKKLILHMFSKSDYIITLSQYWKNFVVEKLNVEPKNVKILYNSYGFEFTGFNHNSNYLSLKQRKKIITIFFVGSLNQNKGVYDLIKIVKQLLNEFHDFFVVIVGSANNGHCKNSLLQQVVRNGIKSHVQFIDEICGQKKLDWFAKSDIFILPSYFENSPITILEAMRAGLPIIATPVGAVPEIIKENKNGFLVAPGDIQTFADRLLKLCTDSNLRLRMAHTNLKTAKKKYNPENYGKRLQFIYDELNH